MKDGKHACGAGPGWYRLGEPGTGCKGGRRASMVLEALWNAELVVGPMRAAKKEKWLAVMVFCRLGETILIFQNVIKPICLKIEDQIIGLASKLDCSIEISSSYFFVIEINNSFIHDSVVGATYIRSIKTFRSTFTDIPLASPTS